MQTLTCLALAALAYLAPRQPMQQAPTSQPAATSSETIEDAAVLERLLKDAIQGASRTDAQRSAAGSLVDPRDDGRTAGALDAYSIFALNAVSAIRVERSRAFHLPGAGVFIAIDVGVPVVPRAEQESAPEPDAKEPDAWDRARRELNGRPSASTEPREESEPESSEQTLFRYDALSQAMQTYTTARWDLDEDSIGRARDAVLDVLARYGQRVRGLASDETITVALYVTSSAERLAGSTLGQSTNGGVPLLQYYMQNGDPNVPQERWKFWLDRYAAGEARAVHLVVQAHVGDLASSAVAADPPAKLRERAQVHRY